MDGGVVEYFEEGGVRSTLRGICVVGGSRVGEGEYVVSKEGPETRTYRSSTVGRGMRCRPRIS